MEPKRRRYPENKGLQITISRIQRVIHGAGYRPDAMVPLSHFISVVAYKDEDWFNIRIDKKTFTIVSIERLSYIYTRDRKIKSVSRTKI
jgi:hypothetical protein